MRPTEWLREHHTEYDELSELLAACSKATGSDTMTCRKLHQRLRRRGELSKDPSGATSIKINNHSQLKSVGLTESALRAKHDKVYIVSQIVEKLKKDIFLTDHEFVKMCNFSNLMGYRVILDHPDFSKFKGKAGSSTYWSHPDSIEKMKTEGVLS